MKLFSIFTERKKSRWLDVTIAGATILFMVLALTAQQQYSQRGAIDCKKPGSTHTLTLQNDAFSTNKLSVKRCDVITVVNKSNDTFELAFGVHERHITYPGYTMQTLSQNEYLIINARKAGTYQFHDHLRDNAQIELEIN